MRISDDSDWLTLIARYVLERVTLLKRGAHNTYCSPLLNFLMMFPHQEMSLEEKFAIIEARRAENVKRRREFFKDLYCKYTQHIS